MSTETDNKTVRVGDVVKWNLSGVPETVKEVGEDDGFLWFKTSLSNFIRWDMDSDNYTIVSRASDPSLAERVSELERAIAELKATDKPLVRSGCEDDWEDGVWKHSLTGLMVARFDGCRWVHPGDDTGWIVEDDYPRTFDWDGTRLTRISTTRPKGLPPHPNEKPQTYTGDWREWLGGADGWYTGSLDDDTFDVAIRGGEVWIRSNYNRSWRQPKFRCFGGTYTLHSTELPDDLPAPEPVYEAVGWDAPEGVYLADNKIEGYMRNGKSVRIDPKGRLYTRDQRDHTKPFGETPVRYLGPGKVSIVLDEQGGGA